MHLSPIPSTEITKLIRSTAPCPTPRPQMTDQQRMAEPPTREPFLEVDNVTVSHTTAGGYPSAATSASMEKLSDVQPLVPMEQMNVAQPVQYEVCFKSH